MGNHMKDTLLFMTNEQMGSINEDKTLSFFNSQYVEQYNKINSPSNYVSSGRLKGQEQSLWEWTKIFLT